jgi:acetyltransferase-like isoleucine patch superfamily enzyme
VLQRSELAPGLLVGEDVQLPGDVELGANVVIHAGTVVSEGACLQDGAVVGKPLALGPHSLASREALPPATIGRGATICAGAVVLAGAWIGEEAVIGDQAHVRERAVVGERTAVGRGSQVDADVRVGSDVRIQTGCYITGFSEVEDHVFVGPGVTLTNDDAMGRHPPEQQLRGAVLRRACRVGGGAVLVPGVEVGEEAYIAAGAVVTRDVPPRAVVMGVPARKVREVPDEDLQERWT